MRNLPRERTAPHVQARIIDAPLAHVAVIFLLGTLTACSDAPNGGFPSRELLAERYTQAVNADDPRALKETIHPASRAAGEGSRDLYEEHIQTDLTLQVPDEHEVSFRELDAGEGLPFARWVDYPIAPTHEMQIDYQKDERASISVVRPVVRDGDRWFYVVALPKKELVPTIRARKTRAAAEQEHAARRARELDPALRTEILRLLRRNQTIPALKKLEQRYPDEEQTRLVQMLKVLQEESASGATGG